MRLDSINRSTLAYWRKTKPYLFNLATMLTLAGQDDEVDTLLLDARKKGIKAAIEIMEGSKNDAVRLKALNFLQRYYFGPMDEQLEDLERRLAEKVGAEAASKKRKATNFAPVQVLVQVTNTPDGRPIPVMDGMEARSSLEDFAEDDDDVIEGDAEVVG